MVKTRKSKVEGWGEMEQQLQCLAARAESTFSSWTQVGQFPTTRNSCFRGSNVLSDLCRHTHTYNAHTDEQTWELTGKGKRANGGGESLGAESRGESSLVTHRWECAMTKC